MLVQPNQYFFLHDDGDVEKINEEQYVSYVVPFGQAPFWPHKVVVVSEVVYTDTNVETILFDECPIILTSDQNKKSKQAFM